MHYVVSNLSVPYEKAGFLHRRFRHHREDIPTVATELGINPGEARHLMFPFDRLPRRSSDRNRRSCRRARSPVGVLHRVDEIIYPKEGYLGLTYTGDLILIQITWIGGRSIEVKKKFYKRIADEIHERTGVRKEDVWINLVDDAREDWSFGNGEMQYAKMRLRKLTHIDPQRREHASAPARRIARQGQTAIVGDAGEVNWQGRAARCIALLASG